MMRQTPAAQAVKKISRCQHLKKAVARRACARDEAKLRGLLKGSTACALKWLDCMYWSPNIVDVGDVVVVVVVPRSLS